MKYILFVVISLLFHKSSAQTITTCVGNGIVGYSGDGGSATDARLNIPQGINFDNSGNLLICHHVLVRKVNVASNIITTIAGSDTATSAGGGGNGGPATCAMLIEPYDIAVDAIGNYYVPDYWTATIRKVAVASGIINVYAGAMYMLGSSGDNGPATAAKVGGIGAIRIDTARKILYMTDIWNYKIRKVDMVSGIISTFAGDGINGFYGDGGSATVAQFSKVYGLGLDKNGNVYVGDWDNKRIRKVDITTGIITTIAGNGINGYGGDGGPATAAMMKKPSSFCFDTCGNLYFSDEDNNCVRRIDAATNIITTIAGNGMPGFSGDGGPATAAQFNHPTGVCIDKNFNLYVGDYYNHRVRKIALGNCSGTGVVGVENMVQNRVIIYPNPANEEVHIEGAQPLTTYQLYNIVGVVQQSGLINTGNKTITIKHLPPGLYVLALTGEEGKRTVHKIVKE